MINGEPTDNQLGVATRGVLRVLLKASGRASHSSYPELGESAIEKLVSALVSLRDLPLPEDSVMGRTHYTVGLIAGGIAPNVVPPAAEAEVVFRTVGEVDKLKASLIVLEPLVRIEEVLEVPPVTMPRVPGFETAAFPYTTDIPFLSTWGTPSLLGPGSIQVAHTDHECVQIGDLRRAVDQYEALAQHLLDRPRRPRS